MNLGGLEHIYLDSEEECLFYQEDVAWYEEVEYKLWDSIAAGTLYLTNRQILLYDPGFRNIWTMLSKDGDFPKRVLTKEITEIDSAMNGLQLSENGAYGTYIKGFKGDCFLQPSFRKYKNRKTPMASNYSSMQDFAMMVIKLQTFYR